MATKRAKATSVMVAVMELQTKRTFIGRKGDEVELKDPDGKPSDKQLYMLWSKGLLVIAASASEDNRFSKGEASWALDQVKA